MLGSRRNDEVVFDKPELLEQKQFYSRYYYNPSQ